MPPRTRKPEPEDTKPEPVADDVTDVETVEEVADEDVPALAAAMQAEPDNVPASPVDSPENKADGEGVVIQDPDSTSPEPEILPPSRPKTDEELQAEFDAQRTVDRSHWPFEPAILWLVPHVVRGDAAHQLLEAAEELGYPADAVKSQTDGFRVPSAIYYHLFPSQVPAPADDNDD